VRACPGDHLPESGGDALNGPRASDSSLPGGHPGVGYPGCGDRTTGILVTPHGGGREVPGGHHPRGHLVPDGLSVEGNGKRMAPGSAAPEAGESSTRAPYAGAPAAATSPYDGGGYSCVAWGSSAAGHTSYAGSNSVAEAVPRRAERLSWGPVPTCRGPAHEYPFDPHDRDHYGGYARCRIKRSVTPAHRNR